MGWGSMGLSHSKKKSIIVDPLHGDIHLTPREREVIATPTFQRLRHIKQLGMGHLTYPNATHTRFAHSLGVFAIMKKIVNMPDSEANQILNDEEKEDLCFAALVHDIGHYPYSHLMERVDNVALTEDIVASGKSKDKSVSFPDEILQYPHHETLGKEIITSQPDIIKAFRGKERAEDVARLFSKTESAKPLLSNLIHSSLDMDRLDYLQRDSHAAGVPYGQVDMNYLLNCMRISSEGVVGVDAKALPAAEQFLMARFFMLTLCTKPCITTKQLLDLKKPLDNYSNAPKTKGLFIKMVGK